MPDLVKYSDVTPTQAADVNNNALVSMANVENNAYVSGVVTMTGLGTKLNNNVEYSSALQTTSKTIIGAINEVAQGGGGGGSSTLAGLTDVTITTPSNNQVLKYNSSTNKWENGSGSGTTTSLSDLSDVTLTTPINGQTLVYDSANSRWINDNASESSYIYSTTERVVGVWTDGTTPVYEKVCTGTTNQDTAPILVEGVDKIISATGHAGVYSIPAIQLDNNRRYISVVISNGDIKVFTMGSNYAGLSFEIVLRYTKSSS